MSHETQREFERRLELGEAHVEPSAPIAPDTVTTTQSSPLVPNADSITPATTTPTTTALDPTLGGAITPESTARGVLVGQQVATNITAPQLAPAATQTLTPITEQVGETISPTLDIFQVGEEVQRAEAVTAEAQAPVIAPTTLTSAQVETALVGAGAAGTEAAAEQRQLDPGTEAVAALGALPPEAMVQSQMEELTAGLEKGEIPQWAQPAVDAVEAQLAARGLSRSSVGAAALTNAIIQTALPMAQSNAQAVRSNFAQDKQSQQQVNVLNAQAALQFQVQSLGNRQQTAIQDSNLRQQAMLSDQAATNASSQFNAASTNQTQQFMANLEANINTQNAARLDAMSQFNAQNENAMNQFASSQRFAREQFNAQNATQIEQSNLQWRRQMNQINTAGVNAVNQANAMNSFNLSNQALTFMWQEMRDAAKWSFEATQNDQQRAAALAQAAMGNEASTDVAKMESIAALGAAAINIWKD